MLCEFEEVDRPETIQWDVYFSWAEILVTKYTEMMTGNASENAVL